MTNKEDEREIVEEKLQAVINYFTDKSQERGKSFNLFSDVPDLEDDAIIYYDFYMPDEESKSGLIRAGLRFNYNLGIYGYELSTALPSIYSLDDIRNDTDELVRKVSSFNDTEIYVSDEDWNEYWVVSFIGDRITFASGYDDAGKGCRKVEGRRQISADQSAIIPVIFKNKLEKLVVGDDVRKAVDIALEMYDTSAKDLGLE